MASLKSFASDKVWVITGAASGIGLEMTRLVARQHGIVWALDRNADKLAELEAEAKKENWDVFIFPFDVTRLKEIDSLISHIQQQSRRIDVWINNAGIQRVGAFLATDSNSFDHVMEVNLTSVISLTRAVAKAMEIQGSGVILNMASAAGHIPAPFMSAYVASKHAVVGFTRSLAAEFELLRSPIRIAFASPGFVDTAIIERGREQGFPEWLSWMLTDAKDCARDILVDLAKGVNEIQPTLSGSMMRAAYAIMPKATVRGSKVLLTKGFKDLLLNRFQVPRG